MRNDEELRLTPQFNKTLASSLGLPGPRMGLLHVYWSLTAPKILRTQLWQQEWQLQVRSGSLAEPSDERTATAFG